MTSLSPLRLKHLLAVSPIGPTAGKAVGTMRRLTANRTPELSLLAVEEEFIGKAIRKIVKRGDVCLDIGAHIGSVAKLLEDVCGRRRVHLVEAVPEKAAWLAHRFGDDFVHTCALGTTSAKVKFYVDERRPGFSSLEPRSGQGIREIEVDMRTLDDVFPDLDVKFVKIDVEGSELDVLRSGQAMIDRSRPTILFEAGSVKNATAQQSDDLFDWLVNTAEYDVVAAFQYGHDAPCLTLDQFRLCRTYPYLAFNYLALPRTQGREE